MKRVITLFFVILFLDVSIVKGQYYSIIVDFNGSNNPQGFQPYGNVILSGNTLYGMTNTGGLAGSGNIFQVNINGKNYKDLYDFGGGPAGQCPYGSLMLSRGKLYGMTIQGGNVALGNIFSIDTNGNNYKDLHDFPNINLGSGSPEGNLILIGDNLYGMTLDGMAPLFGNIFCIDTNGNGYRDLWDFDGTDTNGAGAPGSLLFLGGKLYGMTVGGGIYDSGVIFSIDTNGENYKDLFNFNFKSGFAPVGSLVSSRGKLYGMTSSGGKGPTDGVVFSIDMDGNNYKILQYFNGTNGGGTTGSLILSTTQDSLFGMSTLGGKYKDGVVFSIDTNGNAYTILHDFDSIDGLAPYGDLTMGGNIFYGMTPLGGTHDAGVVFAYGKSSPLGIDNKKSNNTEALVYPNPNNGQFNVLLSHPELISASQPILEVYNVLGEQVLSETLSRLRRDQGDKSIDLSNQPNGIYLYRVISETGNLLGEGKIIIDK